MKKEFRKQNIYDTNKNVVRQEFLYKDIPKLLKVQKRTKDKVALDLVLLEKFLQERKIPQKELNELKIHHFNINAETLMLKKDKVTSLFEKETNKNSKIILELLEWSCWRCNHVLPADCEENINSLLKDINIDWFALDDFPTWFSNFENASKDFSTIIKVDWKFWNQVFKEYDSKQRLDVLKKEMENRITKVEANWVEAVVIEGIETKKQWRFVKKLDKDVDMNILWQGFYLHRPE